MAENPACKTFIPLLSPFIDGELSVSERTGVERHLAVCAQCTMRAADLRAESSLVRVGFEMLADEADFKDFSQKVLARVTPEKPPLLERLRIGLTEAFTYQRRIWVTSMATAAVAVLATLPFVLRDRTPAGYGAKRLEVHAVTSDDEAHFSPVVWKTESGDTIIWSVEKSDDAAKPGEPGTETPAGSMRDAAKASEELEMDTESTGAATPEGKVSKDKAGKSKNGGVPLEGSVDRDSKEGSKDAAKERPTGGEL